MGIFNRKNEEIIELKETADELQEQVKTLQEEINDLKQELIQENDLFVKKVDDFEEFFKGYLENRINEVLKDVDNVKFSFDKRLKEIEEEPAQVPRNESKANHLFKIKGSFAVPYKEIKLQGSSLISYKRKFSFNINDVINIKDNLRKYYEEGLSVRAIGKLNNVNSDTIYKLVWNIEEGYFDKVINDYLSKVYVEDDNHYRKVSKTQKKPLNVNLVSFDKDGKLFISGKRVQYSINDIKELKKRIPDFENYPNNNDLFKDMSIGDFGGAVLVWRVEEGYFDSVINDYEKMFCGVEEKWHIFKLKKSYHKPYTDLVVGHGGVLYSSNNQKLIFTIQDVIMIKDRIYSNKYNNLSDLKEGFDYSRQMFNRIVWNIEEGYFDELIEEYTSRNYTYENIMNTLYIDGENTGLTIDKCNLIVDCVVNENNKQECVNRLIRTYPSTKPKYIRIISEEYNNVNLGKVLKKEVKKVDKVDNPQKRRELGVY